MEKKKVLHIVEAFGGGVYTFMEALVNGMAKDFDVTVAYALRSQTPEDFKERFDDSVKFVLVENFTRSISLVKDLRALAEIRKIIKQVQPDVIHLHSSKAGVLGRLGVNCKKYKVYYTPHGYSFLKQDDSGLKRKIYQWIEWICARTRSTVVAVSKGEYEATLKLTSRATYINNGIDMKYLSAMAGENSSAKKFTKDKLRIGTIGRVCYQKNPSFFNSVAEKFPEHEFVWVGEGELLGELTSLNISVTGWQDRSKTMQFLKDMDVFLLPSLWEGLPISLLEAMFLKKICIVSNVIGNRDVIVNGVNGFVGDSVEDFVSVIQDIQDGKIDTEQIANNAYEDVLREYNTEVMVQKYKELYRA